MKLKDGLQVWAERWRQLKAWGRDLDEVTIVVRQRHAGDYATGHAYPTLRRLVITAPNMPLGLECLLHELAHVVVSGDECHSDRWREVFTKAIAEVTNIRVAPSGAIEHLEHAAEAAVMMWWKTSGNEFAWSLVRDRKVG